MPNRDFLRSLFRPKFFLCCFSPSHILKIQFFYFFFFPSLSIVIRQLPKQFRRNDGGRGRGPVVVPTTIAQQQQGTKEKCCREKEQESFDYGCLSEGRRSQDPDRLWFSMQHLQDRPSGMWWPEAVLPLRQSRMRGTLSPFPPIPLRQIWYLWFFLFFLLRCGFIFLEFCFFSIPANPISTPLVFVGIWCVFYLLFFYFYLSFSFDDLSYLSVLGSW